MTIEKIPFAYSFEDCNPRYRLLNQINGMFVDTNESAIVPPLFKLLSILKEKFCTSCSLVSLEEGDKHSENVSLILKSMKELYDGSQQNGTQQQQDYITGYQGSTDETFLAVTMPEGLTSELNESFVLIMWRKGRIFTAEDVITARTSVNLFYSLFREAYAPKKPNSQQAKASELISCSSHLPASDISTQTMVHLYGEALDLVSKCVVITDREGSLIHLNKCAEALFSRPCSSDEMIQSYTGGIDWFAGLLHPDDLASLVSAWNTAQQTKEEFNLEFRLQICANRPEYHLFGCHSRPIKASSDEANNSSASANVDYWIFCMFDMEQARLMEETKLAAGRKTKFLAEMSHEIRTPLACVIGTCSLLRYTPLSKEQGDLLNTIRVCSQQLFTLTNNILDLSRIEESKLLLDSHPVYLERTVTDVIDIFVPDLVKKNVDVALNICYPEVPETIISDEGRLKQIITNILSNAIKYTRENSTITIHVRKIGGDCSTHLNSTPSKLKFEICDEGPGIPENIPQSQLFDTFVQLDSSTYRKYGGSGLGLTISKKLVNLLQGDIWYQSLVGQGTTMNFTISLKEPTAIELADVPTGLDVTSSFRHLWSLREFVNTLRPTTPISILLAMQKPKMNEFLLRLLRKTSVIEVEMADPDRINCENAIVSELISHEPTILITDLNYRDELRRAMGDSLVKAVIILDGEQEIQVEDDGRSFRSLRKPVKPAQLVKTIHEILLIVLSSFEPAQKLLVLSDSKIPSPRSKWLEEGSSGSILSSGGEGDVMEGIHKTRTVVENPIPAITSVPQHSSMSTANTISRPEGLSTGSFAKSYPINLMLAEDNLLNQQLMTRILAKYGYVELYVVDNGRQAFEVFRRLSQQETPIEAIFMDMQMPEVEGPEATQLIRQFCRQIGCPQPHIMALTAKAFSEDRAECMRAGMCTYLSKPVRWTTLEEELIRAHEAVNNRFKCICNEERIGAIEPAIGNEIDAEPSNRIIAASDEGDEMKSLPTAKPTGLDV